MTLGDGIIKWGLGILHVCIILTSSEVMEGKGVLKNTYS
jgi:hypothetical protein